MAALPKRLLTLGQQTNADIDGLRRLSYTRPGSDQKKSPNGD